MRKTGTLLCMIIMLATALCSSAFDSEDLESIVDALQEGASFEELDQMPSWKALDGISDVDARKLRDMPFDFIGSAYRTCQKKLGEMALELEHDGEFDSEITLLDRMLSLGRSYDWHSANRRGIIQKLCYPLFMGGKLSINQRTRLLEMLSRQMQALRTEDMRELGEAKEGSYIDYYKSAILADEFCLRLMESLSPGHGDVQSRKVKLLDCMKEIASKCGVRIDYIDVNLSPYGNNSEFTMICSSPNSFYYANGKQFIYKSEIRPQKNAKKADGTAAETDN